MIEEYRHRTQDAAVVEEKEAEAATERERIAEWLVTYHENAEDFKKEEKYENKNPE